MENCMNEEDLLNDILLCEKNISNCYSVAINEMSNKVLYKKITDIFVDTKNIARDIYNYMYSMGWYDVTSETEKKIEDSYNKYKNKYDELN